MSKYKVFRCERKDLQGCRRLARCDCETMGTSWYQVNNLGNMRNGLWLCQSHAPSSQTSDSKILAFSGQQALFFLTIIFSLRKIKREGKLHLLYIETSISSHSQDSSKTLPKSWPGTLILSVDHFKLISLIFINNNKLVHRRTRKSCRPKSHWENFVTGQSLKNLRS